MPVITKRVLRDRTYYPNGSAPETFTRERIAHMAAEFRAMKAAGLRVPVPFTHPGPTDPLFMPVPVQRAEGRQFSPANHAGWLADVRLTDDGWMEWDIEPRPGVTEDQLDHFSPAIAREFRDGAGRVWKDCITHAAAVYHPIAFDQPSGFVGRQDGVAVMGVRTFAAEARPRVSAVDVMLGKAPYPFQR